VPRAYIGLGANLGPREETLLRAVDLLAAVDGVEVVAVSQLRETEPVGVLDQPRFLNGAVAVETTLGPRELLDVLLRIERELGRTRDGTRWGPRTVDLDLLAYADELVGRFVARLRGAGLLERVARRELAPYACARELLARTARKA